jgi:hypothetical protein
MLLGADHLLVTGKLKPDSFKSEARTQIVDARKQKKRNGH